MIVMITGTPGSGKSLKAAYQIIDCLEHGYNVITNYEVDLSQYNKKFALKYQQKVHCLIEEEMNCPALVRFAVQNHKAKKENQSVIFLDEPDFFNPRDWGRQDRRAWIQFLRLHRKLGYKIYIITQDDILIDKQIRKFIEIERRCRAVRNYKTFGWILSLITGGLFVYNDTWYGSKSKLTLNHGYYVLSKRKARIYDSFNTFCNFKDIADLILHEDCEIDTELDADANI